ncbi:hypothetical protein WBG83_10130 [Paenibacillus sp. y28]
MSHRSSLSAEKRSKEGSSSTQALTGGTHKLVHQVRQLQKVAGNRAVGRLLSGLHDTGPQTAQLALSEQECADKLRILKDYVRFTPPEEFKDAFWKPPKDKVEYRQKLIAKITGSPHTMASVKSKRDMKPDVEDDDWAPNSFNDRTLERAINEVYPRYPTGDGEEIGQEYAPFDKHDCVFAAITHALGFGDDLETSLEVEGQLAAYFNHKKGEVEDSILYRMMERMGWGLYGVGKFNELFRPELDGVMTYPPIGGTFIISENRDAGGTTGHVLVVEISNDLAAQTFPAPKTLKLYDRQYERQNRGKARTGEPTFDVYAWRVENTEQAQEVKKILQG